MYAINLTGTTVEKNKEVLKSLLLTFQPPGITGKALWELDEQIMSSQIEMSLDDSSLQNVLSFQHAADNIL